MARLSIGVVYLLLFSCLATADQLSQKSAERVEWSDFVSREGRFSLSLPSKPTEQTYQINSPVGPIDMHMFASLGAEGATYTFAYFDVPGLGSSPAAIASALDSARDSLANSTNSQVRDEKAIQLGSFPGREVRSTSAMAIVTSRIYLVKIRLYVTSAWVPMAIQESELINKNKLRFLDSFKLNTE